MSVLFQFWSGIGKLHQIRKCNSINPYKYIFYRYFSDNVSRFLLFDDVIHQRRAEARRSLVVQVNSESSFGELYNYCAKYAEVNGIHHYKNGRDEHFMLIEFGSEIHVNNIMKNCSMHQLNQEIMPVKSPFLWFRALPGSKEKASVPRDVTPITKDGNSPVDENILFDDLLKCSSTSEQIQLLYDKTVLNDLGIRLRYIIATQLESLFESLYTDVIVRPFGSSINGFGRSGCDLDLVLIIDNGFHNSKDLSTRRLVFHEKKCDGRSPCQKHIELVADLLEARVVGASKVLRIPNARVPIVKYAHELTNIDCDLCCNNMSGVYMSELLWLYGSMDRRVRPLTFVIRRWAHAVGLTNSHPGRWITNFPLTLMVLFFLQQKSKDGAVLPSLKYLVKNAGKEDKRIAEDNLNCTFLRDLNKLPINSYGNNSATLEELLLQFFEFYSLFEFNENAISINEGVAIRKPNSSPLYIVNPLEQSLNVSRNVSYDECERLKMEVRNAAWQLETSREGARSSDWGIIGLIEKLASRNLKKLIRSGNSNRLLSVKDLFTGETDAVEVNELRDRLQRLTKAMVPPKGDKTVHQEVDKFNLKSDPEVKANSKKTGPKVIYKNEQVRREIRRIRRNKMI